MTSSTHSKTSNGLQGDLLSGEWLSEPPRRGGGQHIRLKPLGDDQRVAIPGMADFSGGGPAGTYCRDCNHFADEIAVQTGINTIEKTRFRLRDLGAENGTCRPFTAPRYSAVPQLQALRATGGRIAPMLHHRQWPA